MKTVLVIEDSIKSQKFVEASLDGKFRTIIKNSVPEADEYLSTQSPDLIVLDINLQGEDGLSFFTRISSLGKIKTIPVIFMTSHDDISYKILAFKLGAQDYIVKPIQSMELLLRVEARLKGQQPSDELYITDESYLKRSQNIVYYNEDGKNEKINRSPIEVRLLSFFMENSDHIFNRDQIFDAVWGKDTHLTDRTIDRHVSALKSKVPILKSLLQSIYGCGYMFSKNNTTTAASNRSA